MPLKSGVTWEFEGWDNGFWSHFSFDDEKEARAEFKRAHAHWARRPEAAPREPVLFRVERVSVPAR